MALMRRFIIHAWIVLVILATILSRPHSVTAAEPLASDGKALLAKYADLKTQLAKNQFLCQGLILYLTSAILLISYNNNPR